VTSVRAAEPFGRVRPAVDAPLPDRVRRGLRATVVGGAHLAYARVSSTNDVALAMARSGCPDGLVVTAEEQWAGRGRLGRAWHSPPGAGLWVSVVLRPDLPLASAQALTFLGAVAGAAALKRVARLAATLKWPNDLLHDDRKLGGVLVESGAEAALIRHAVIGIGINVHLAREAFPPALRDLATSVRAATGRRVSRVTLSRALLEEIDDRYARLRREGPAGLIREARSLMAMSGRIVRVQTHDGIREGTVRGMDDDGALLIRLPSGAVERLLAGDVSVLR
jgi:BirA family biotin operon repressor/biotin-[acetyl-CoA-carboxylase] ligase